MPDPKISGLLDARAGVVEEEQQRAIALRGPSTGRHPVEECADIVAIEEVRLRRCHPLGRECVRYTIAGRVIFGCGLSTKVCEHVIGLLPEMKANADAGGFPMVIPDRPRCEPWPYD